VVAGLSAVADSSESEATVTWEKRFLWSDEGVVEQ
jgi:hypothetical protein